MGTFAATTTRTTTRASCTGSGSATAGRAGFCPTVARASSGARVIHLHEGERTFRTWVRLADGSRLEQAEHEPEAWARSA